MIKVSVIVPVYNVEKYLAKCLDSLICQTLDDIEIIIVNDGSTDGCQKIIEDYKQRHPDKITAISKENEGPGSARNAGVSRARGEYVGFVDADDWVEPDMYKLLYSTAKENGSDVVICDIGKMVKTGDGFTLSEIWKGVGNEGKTVADFILDSIKAPAPVNKIYRRDLAAGIPYPYTCYAEDIATIPVILSHSSIISYIPQPLYYYHLMRPESLTTRKNNPRCVEIIQAWERCLRDCNAGYKQEMEYAVYLSVAENLVILDRHMYDILDFFRGYEEKFRHNRYIQKLVQENRLYDIFDIFNISAIDEQSSNPYVKDIINLVNETTPLFGQLEELPDDMVYQLRDMYSFTLQLALKNVNATGTKLIVILTDRQERIAKRL